MTQAYTIAVTLAEDHASASYYIWEWRQGRRVQVGRRITRSLNLAGGPPSPAALLRALATAYDGAALPLATLDGGAVPGAPWGGGGHLEPSTLT